MPPHILLVDDQETLCRSLSFTLTREGYEVTTAAEGRAALSATAAGAFNLILLDLMLPGINGVEVCRRLRSHTTVPIIMLTARDHEIDKIVGLETGADDYYITKPFSTKELLARIRAVLRRTGREGRPAGDSAALATGRIVLDRDRA